MKVRKSRRVDMMQGIEHYVDVMDVDSSSDEMDWTSSGLSAPILQQPPPIVSPSWGISASFGATFPASPPVPVPSWSTIMSSGTPVHAQVPAASVPALPTQAAGTVGIGAPLTRENVARLSGEAGGSSRQDYQDTRTASLDSQMTFNPQKVQDERARRLARNAANIGRA
ncbi:hypothetical protein BSKO_06883 [Bryopsis sp. KO-2023]|nr:hypothetical protein BSKO_06883 [Bryopsis sp. KO-2023]